ncbi:MAG: CPBP family intramembrane glutamic endopeptidase [Candidatus Acidiferrales bacterium]
MATNAAVQLNPPGPKLIAPVWHTVLLAALFLSLTVMGAIFQHIAQTHPGQLQQHQHVVPLYLSLIAMEWGLVCYVRAGLRKTGTRMSELVGERWTSAKYIIRDVALGVGLWALWGSLEMVGSRWFAPSHAASIQPLLPKSLVELLLWIALSASAGICEEIVFRGYFQEQFKRLTGSALAGVALQAVLFGVGHGYQGTQATIKIAALGALYGLLAMWRKSLRPCMIAHAWTDIFSGLITR